MRSVLTCALLFICFSGCRCSSPPPTQITLKATNDLDFDIFVLNEVGEGGMSVDRPGASGGAPTTIGEAPACSCLDCKNACSASINPDGGACACQSQLSVHRIAAGQSFTRTFDGTEHAATRADCGVGDLGPVCFQSGQPLESGKYKLHLCYATNFTQGPQGDAGNDFNATLPTSSLSCVDQDFTYPDQTLVEVKPPKPPPCGAANACPSGQLCQRGICSATCLPSGVPAEGATWNTSAEIYDDEGFFTNTSGPIVRSTGQGQVGSAIYNGNDLRLALTRVVGVGHASGGINIVLPSTSPIVPFEPGETLNVLVIQADESRDNGQAAAITDANGNLLLAVDQGPGGPLLSATDVAPFTIDPNGDVFGCDQEPICGRRVYRSMNFAAGSAPVSIEPGSMASLAGPGGDFRAVVVANYKDDSGDVQDCGLEPVNAYSLVRDDRHF
jgi:hypothetical protein